MTSAKSRHCIAKARVRREVLYLFFPGWPAQKAESQRVKPSTATVTSSHHLIQTDPKFTGGLNFNANLVEAQL